MSFNGTLDLLESAPDARDEEPEAVRAYLDDFNGLDWQPLGVTVAEVLFRVAGDLVTASIARRDECRRLVEHLERLAMSHDEATAAIANDALAGVDAPFIVMVPADYTREQVEELGKAMEKAGKGQGLLMPMPPDSVAPVAPFERIAAGLRAERRACVAQREARRAEGDAVGEAMSDFLIARTDEALAAVWSSFGDLMDGVPDPSKAMPDHAGAPEWMPLATANEARKWSDPTTNQEGDRDEAAWLRAKNEAAQRRGGISPKDLEDFVSE